MRALGDELPCAGVKVVSAWLRESMVLLSLRCAFSLCAPGSTLSIRSGGHWFPYGSLSWSAQAWALGGNFLGSIPAQACRKMGVRLK